VVVETVFCIDGSGNRDRKAADRKRPVYRLDVGSGMITRPFLDGSETALQFFARQISDDTLPKPVLIAADLPIGMPAQPSDVFQTVCAQTFLEWLGATEKRHATNDLTWREGLIAAGVSQRSALRPFVSIKKGDKTGSVRAKRLCDMASGAENGEGCEGD
jgi:hypothetical protein